MEAVVTDRPVADREPLSARWFHVGRPWSDQPGLIYAGAEDPHAGTFVVDCGDWSDETHFGAVQTVDVAALADGIVRDHNATLDAARPADESRLREALEYARDGYERLAEMVGSGTDSWGIHGEVNHRLARCRAALAQPAVPVADPREREEPRA
jgi:hypothetical protein